MARAIWIAPRVALGPQPPWQHGMRATSFPSASPTSESIIGTQFTGTLVRDVQIGEYSAVEPVVTGAAYITGIQQFVVDPRDPVKYGFHIENGALR